MVRTARKFSLLLSHAQPSSSAAVKESPHYRDSFQAAENLGVAANLEAQPVP